MFTRHQQIVKDGADLKGSDYFTSHCTEVVMVILKCCNAKDVLNIGSTCKRLNTICYHCEPVWRQLCWVDFDAQLPTRGSFDSYYQVYKLLYQSRLVMGAHVYGRYFEKRHLSTIPGWLWCMAALSEKPPVMKFGKNRFVKRCSGHYLQRFSQVPLGQLRRAWGLQGEKDLAGLFPHRVERGTVYYPFQAARYALFRKYNGKTGYYRFILNKCFRARRIVASNFEKIKGKNPIRLL